MKSIEILTEVLKPEMKSLYVLERYFTSDCVSPKNCIEAMKIAMKQAWLASHDFYECFTSEQDEINFNTWFNKLEGGKE